MGQKVHPTGFRLGIATDWTSKWYAEKGEFAKYLHEDLTVRAYIRKKLAQASVSRVQIERPAKAAVITIHSARPGIVIGKKGEDIERLRNEVSVMLGISKNTVKINIEEIRKPELDATLVCRRCRTTIRKTYHVSSCNASRGH